MSQTRIGVSIYSYNGDTRVGLMTVQEAIEHAASLGVEGIELVDKMHLPNYPHPSVSDLLELRDCVESLGMQVVCYSFYVNEHIFSRRPGTQDELLRQVKAAIANANVLGAPIARPMGALRTALQAVPYAERLGVRLGIELHFPMKPRQVFDQLKAAGALGCLGVIPDFGCWQDLGLGQPAPVEDFAYLLPHAIHIHAKAHGFDGHGEEPSIPYRHLLAELKQAEFAGFVVVEFEGHIREDYSGRSRQAVATHVNLLRKYLA